MSITKTWGKTQIKTQLKRMLTSTLIPGVFTVDRPIVPWIWSGKKRLTAKIFDDNGKRIDLVAGWTPKHFYNPKCVGMKQAGESVFYTLPPPEDQSESIDPGRQNETAGLGEGGQASRPALPLASEGHAGRGQSRGNMSLPTRPPRQAQTGGGNGRESPPRPPAGPPPPADPRTPTRPSHRNIVAGNQPGSRRKRGADTSPQSRKRQRRTGN